MFCTVRRANIFSNLLPNNGNIKKNYFPIFHFAATIVNLILLSSECSSRIYILANKNALCVNSTKVLKDTFVYKIMVTERRNKTIKTLKAIVRPYCNDIR